MKLKLLHVNYLHTSSFTVSRNSGHAWPKTKDKKLLRRFMFYVLQFLGREQRLGAERVNVEFLAMRKYHQVVPGSVPEMYFYDEDTKCGKAVDTIGNYSK